MSTELERQTTALSTEVLGTCKQIERIAQECSLAAIQNQGKFEQAFILARGVEQLRAIITEDMMKPIMALQGTSLGFRTDKDKEGGYRWEIVRECLIEGTLRGWHPVNNEWNIITGRAYGTKNGLARGIAEFPGLTELKRSFGVPHLAKEGAGAIVNHEASWQLNGVSDAIKGEMAIRVNAGQGTDAILGKAHRKQSALILDRLTGSQQSIDGDVDDIDVPGVRVVNGSSLKEKVAAQKAKLQGEVTVSSPGPEEAAVLPTAAAAPTQTPAPSLLPPDAAPGQEEIDAEVRRDAAIAALRVLWVVLSDAEQKKAGRTLLTKVAKDKGLSEWVQMEFKQMLAALDESRVNAAIDLLKSRQSTETADKTM